MRRFTTGITLLIPALTVPGCGSAKRQAEPVLVAYLDAIEHKDWDRALGHCSPLFFSRTPRAVMRGLLVQLHDEYGDLKSYWLDGYEVGTRVGTDAGDSVTFLLRVPYAHALTRETITLIKRPGDETYQVVAHNINPLEGPSGPPTTAPTGPGAAKPR